MTQEILNTVKQIVSDLFDVPPDTVTAESSPQTIEAWDSMQHLNLVMDLEQQFSTQFTPEEVESMTSVQAITDLIASR